MVYWEYEGVQYPDILRQGNACAQISDIAAKYCVGVGLDIGAGAYPFSNAFPIRDSVNYDYFNGKQIRKKQAVSDAICAYNLSCFVDGSLDYVFSSHCLEHLDRPWDALSLWTKKLKPGGIIFLYLPHPDMKLWNAGGPWVGNAHKWIPTFAMLAKYFVKNKIEQIAGSEKKDAFWSFHIVGKKRNG